MSTYPITTYDPKLMLDLRAWTCVDSLLMEGRIVQVRFRNGQGSVDRAIYARTATKSLLTFSVGISIDSEVDRLIKPGDDHVALVAEHDGLASALPHMSS